MISTDSKPGDLNITIPKYPDKEIMKMLIKANYFIESAKKNSFSQNEFDRMIAIHNLDNSIEYILRIVIRHLDIEGITGKSIITCELSQLMGEIKKFLKDYVEKINGIPYENEVKMIREMRNMAQHGLLWAVSDLETYLSYGVKFFDKILKTFFDIEIVDIKYSTIIKSGHIKEQLRLAEDRIKKGKYLESIVASRNAFEYGNFIYNNDSTMRITRAPTLSGLKDNSINMYTYIKNIDEVLNIGLSGIDIKRYQHFKKYLSYIPRKYNLESTGYTVLQRELEDKDAEFCYSFCADAILKWESSIYELIDNVEIIKDENEVEIRFEERMADIIIDTDFQKYGCKYAMGDWYGSLFYMSNKEDLNELKSILSDKEIISKEKSNYIGNNFIWKYCSLIEIINYDINVVMNEPGIWEVIVLYKDIPFTRTEDDSSEGIDLNDIAKIEKIEMDINKKTDLLEYLSKNNPINTIEKAQKVESILGDEWYNYKLYSSKLIESLI